MPVVCAPYTGPAPPSAAARNTSCRGVVPNCTTKPSGAPAIVGAPPRVTSSPYGAVHENSERPSDVDSPTATSSTPVARQRSAIPSVEPATAAPLTSHEPPPRSGRHVHRTAPVRASIATTSPAATPSPTSSASRPSTVDSRLFGRQFFPVYQRENRSAPLIRSWPVISSRSPPPNAVTTTSPATVDATADRSDRRYCQVGRPDCVAYASTPEG